MCFKLGTSKKTWSDAKKDCELSGGQLISIDTEIKMSTTVEFLEDPEKTTDLSQVTDKLHHIKLYTSP
jgi:hypothetical protein